MKIKNLFHLAMRGWLYWVNSFTNVVGSKVLVFTQLFIHTKPFGKNCISWQKLLYFSMLEP